MRLASILILVAYSPIAGQDPGVIVSTPSAPTVSMFDPAYPPKVLKPGELAFCRFGPGARTSRVQPTFDGVNLGIARMDPPTIFATITIFLPTNVTPEIKEHEEGHARLSAYGYAKVAQRLGAAAYAGYTGMRFVGRGATPMARQADAAGQAEAESRRRTGVAAYSIGLEVEKLNDIYDALTRHGTNPAINTAQGEIMAKQRFESGAQVHAEPKSSAPSSHRSRPSKVLGVAAMVCGGLLLLYGLLSYARRA
jgi:hypothetical protein